MFFAADLSLTEKFSQLITGMYGALSKQSNAQDRTAGPLLLLLWTRWCRMRTRFTALVVRMLAGTLAAPVRRPAASPRPARPRPAAAADQPRLPSTRFGWVLRMLPEPWHLNAWRIPLEEILADPETMALVAAGPQAGRILRAMCRMVAMELPEYLKLPKRPRKPRPPRPKVERVLTPEELDAKVAKMGRLAYANVLNPEVDGKANPHRPPNSIGYGPTPRYPKPDPY